MPNSYHSILFLIGFTIFGVPSVFAEDAVQPEPEDGPPRWDTWSGVAATEESIFGYGGLTYALNGDSTKDGWRIRIQGGSGSYSYTGSRETAGGSVDVRHMGQPTLVEILAGYQVRWDALTAKIFVGGQYQNHTVRPFDPENSVTGEKWGAKVALEGWLNVGDQSFASADLTFATPFSTYGGQIRYGIGVFDQFWLGVEIGGYGNETLNAGKAGAFGRWRTSYGTFWLAGGVSGDYDDPSNLYGSFTHVNQF